MVRSLKLVLPAAHLPTFPHLSDDDHSYFVRWKLPTEILEVFDDNKWLRLSSPTIMHFAVRTRGLIFGLTGRYRRELAEPNVCWSENGHCLLKEMVTRLCEKGPPR